MIFTVECSMFSIDKTEEEMKEEDDMQIDLDIKIKEWEKKIKQQHKNMGGVHMSAQHTTQMQKTQRVLDNRLDQVNFLYYISIRYRFFNSFT